MTLEYQLSSLLPYVFYGTWPILLLWEVLVPARKVENPLLARWSGNFGLYAIYILTSRAMIAIFGLSLVVVASNQGLGLISRSAFPSAMTILAGVLLVDLSNYFFHVLSHKLPWLWRLHRVHHNDPEMDFSTSFRHHPIESMASVIFTAIIALIAGFPPETYLICQLLAQMIEPLSHSNIRLPKSLDGVLRLVMVTPAYHIVHHSADRRETDSNYGTIFPFWDRLFRTYVAEPALGEKNMMFGLETFREMKYARLPGALMLPFR